MVPKTQKQWVIHGSNGFDSLEFQKEAPVPSIGDQDVLVQIHATSPNFRDLVIPKGLYPFPLKDRIVPLSDGAGIVVAVGSRVSRFNVGDRVATLVHQRHLAGPLDARGRESALGGQLSGVLREYGAFSEEGLVAVPNNLTLNEAAALPCAALTAWSALYGLEGRALKPGEIVLTEGTGGVSSFAVQFAKAAGARVIATTSSAEKAEQLKKLGADHVINYKENPEWGQLAKSLTPNNEGVSLVVEVGGPSTARQALAALKLNGLISMVGSISAFTSPGSNDTKEPTFLETVIHTCTVQGISIGSRMQFEAMNRAIEVNDLHPVLDARIFKLEEAREAYQYVWDQKHFGKVVIQVAS
ncbi:PKS-ER domain-containing protein [Fusarium falciforme]|uniref:PKS-ER domain-containing protein n=1 Tax=Fusarium falciforme TaxID=195108 RepID=UPI002300CCA9|nr:PKS-ER domain-containing protein [Fusarium falciforme]WAO91773.1 PKS-ER domain-containing protein [Fusarium falciforme]